MAESWSARKVNVYLGIVGVFNDTAYIILPEFCKYTHIDETNDKSVNNKLYF